MMLVGCFKLSSIAGLYLSSTQMGALRCVPAAGSTGIHCAWNLDTDEDGVTFRSCVALIIASVKCKGVMANSSAYR